MLLHMAHVGLEPLQYMYIQIYGAIYEDYLIDVLFNIAHSFDKGHVYFVGYVSHIHIRVETLLY